MDSSVKLLSTINDVVKGTLMELIRLSLIRIDHKQIVV